MKALPAFLSVFVAATFAQSYGNLALDPTGTSIAFTADLPRLGEAAPPDAQRLYRLDRNQLVYVATAPPTPTCGRIANSGLSDPAFVRGGFAYHATTFCTGLFPPVPPRTVYTTFTAGIPNLDATFPGRTMFSANGKFAAVETPASGVKRIDLDSGEYATAPNSIAERRALLFAGPGHTVTDSGEVLLASIDNFTPLFFGGPLFLFDGKGLRPLGVSAQYAEIDPLGRYVILFTGEETQIVNLATSETTTILKSASGPAISISADGSRILLAVGSPRQERGLRLIDDWQNPVASLRIIDIESQTGVISADGRIAATTANGSVWRIDLASGERTEWLGFANRAQPDALYSTAVPGSLLKAVGIFPVAAEQEPEPASQILPIALAGLSAFIDGKPVPAAKATPREFRFQLPWETSPGSRVIEIRHERNAYFALGRWTIESSPSPALLLERNLRNDGVFVTAAHEDFRGLVSQADPAAPGENLHVYATGLGPGIRPVATGQRTPTEGVPLASRPVCSFQNVDANVLYAGLAGGLAGMYQIDIKVPPDLAAGAAYLTCGAPFDGGFVWIGAPKSP